MRIYIAGGVSGNLNPAWKRVAKGMTLPEALERENFWQGGSVGIGSTICTMLRQ